MTIGIDIRVLARGTRSGIEEYTLNLLSYLLPRDKSIKYKLFYNAYRKAVLDFDWLDAPNVELVNSSIPNRIFDISSYYFNFPKADNLLGGVDVFFSPHIFLAALSGKCPSVVTFHDLSFERYREFYSTQKQYWHFSMDPKFQASRAQKIIAVSESTKRDLVEIYDISPDKIEVVYSGIDHEAQFPEGQACGTDTNCEPGIKKVKIKYNLPDKFILYLGTIEPRKNIVGLIRAFELFKKNYGSKADDYKLIIAGAKGWLYQDAFKAYGDSFQKNNIIFTGFIDNKDKKYVYRAADLFVYPSFFEGFGFPPLEAMSNGVPVITSNTSSLPEAVGNAVLTIDPYNIDELAWAINEALVNARVRSRMIKRGFIQIKKFSWEKCAKETLEALKSAK